VIKKLSLKFTVECREKCWVLGYGIRVNLDMGSEWAWIWDQSELGYGIRMNLDMGSD
jgi:hypothetical protein